MSALHPSSSNMVAQSHVAVPVVPPLGGIVEGMQNQEVSAVKKYSVEPNTLDSSTSQISTRNTPTQNVVSSEQLAQLTSLSASLVHFLGAGQQLPQIYAAINSPDANDAPSVAKTEGSGEPVISTFVKPDTSVGFQKQYDPVCDSIELKKADASGITPAFSPRKTTADNSEIPSMLSNSGRQNVDDSSKISSAEDQRIIKSEHLTQLQTDKNSEVNKVNNVVVTEERQDSRADHRNAKDNGPSENVDQNGPDEGKKMKDVKGVRAFKFALVEFVKELLKPTWKDGHINKEDYKTIVKKVVDKVTGTMQGAHIPQTQEKIDHYLTISKPKLNKLVQVSHGSLGCCHYMFDGF